MSVRLVDTDVYRGKGSRRAVCGREGERVRGSGCGVARTKGINTIKVGKQRYSTYLIKGHNVLRARQRDQLMDMGVTEEGQWRGYGGR